MWAPNWGWTIMIEQGAWALDEEVSNEKFCKMSDKAILVSIRAKFWPTHILGPPPNGKNDTWPFVAFEMPSKNLSGLN